MRLYVDTDAFCKLGGGDLLASVAQVAGSSLSECVRLPALPSKLRRGGLARRIGPDLASKLLPLAESLPAAAAPDNAWEEHIRAAEAPIDPGEALLFALVASEMEALLLTGDKRAIVALASLPDLLVALHGRLVTVEAALLAVCRKMGVTHVANCIAPSLFLDTALNVCFSSRDPEEALRRYLQDLEEQIPADVLWKP